MTFVSRIIAEILLFLLKIRTMNKYLVILAMAAVASCGKNGDAEKETNIMLPEPAVEVVDSSAVGKHEGLVLIEGADCLTCHKVEERIIGPSYQEVADKYSAADIDMLASKIIDGGQGNWGEVPMAPHAGMSRENAKKMVEYILTLKK